MRYSFAKIHGLGNDFVVIDDRDSMIDLAPEQVAAICDRHFGVGADGIILVRPATDPSCDAFMHYINSDGTLAQMCGNGVRCFAKFMVDRGMVDPAKGVVVVETLAGPRRISYTLDSAGKLEMARVEMGQPILDPPSIPTTLAPTSDGAVVDAMLSTPIGSLPATCVSMGNPHCVIQMPDRGFFTDPGSFAISEIGPALECDPIFPEKCNIEFVYVDDPGSKDSPARILMRVWERGCGETLACGTGACATAVACHLGGRTVSSAHVKLLGGELLIEVGDGGVVMTGPAVESFTGTFEI